MVELIILIGCVTLGLILWKIIKIIYTCSMWATYDTLRLCRNLKPNLSYFTIFKGVAKQWFVTFFDTFFDQLNGAKRLT